MFVCADGTHYTQNDYEDSAKWYVYTDRVILSKKGVLIRRVKLGKFKEPRQFKSKINTYQK
jgi:hypothetical protein